jgi:hypothetical protein
VAAADLSLCGRASCEPTLSFSFPSLNTYVLLFAEEHVLESGRIIVGLAAVQAKPTGPSPPMRISVKFIPWLSRLRRNAPNVVELLLEGRHISNKLLVLGEPAIQPVQDTRQYKG